MTGSGRSRTTPPRTRATSTSTSAPGSTINYVVSYLVVLSWISPICYIVSDFPIMGFSWPDRLL